ncbi:MAG: class I SAM-dependent methyltransferase [Acidobacteria bacterium]|nr:class I SAM-dependent methyltransferase [Acidobacteriota bacterium]
MINLLLFGALALGMMLTLGWAAPRAGLLVKALLSHIGLGSSRDIELVRYRIAAEESAVYVDEHMRTAKTHADKFWLLRASLNAVDRSRDGLYCEFGVYKGETLNFIASLVKDEVHGFDSFEGLPEDWRSNLGKGTFRVAVLPPVRPNVRLHKGWFQDSLPVFKSEHPQPIAFAHLDADLYSSTKTVFDILGDRIVPGTVLQFDEFFNYPGWRSGEHKAFQELCAARAIEVEYIGYVPTDEQVAVRVTRVGTVVRN